MVGMTVRLCTIALSVALAGFASQPVLGQTPEGRSTAASLDRWIDLQTAELETRYRVIENSADVVTTNHWQHKQSLRAALKFDPAGRYRLNLFAGTGGSFTGSWDSTGVGTGEPDWSPRVRLLYLSAAPIEGLELQTGGFAPIRGESTEITTYDNDAYMVGERVTLRRPERLFVDELSVTAGSIGELDEPNVFERLDGLGEHNYTQILVAKRFGERVGLSADWTSLFGISTFRNGLRLQLPEARVIDGLRFEHYARVEGDAAYGFAITVEKRLTRRIVASGGFSDLDGAYGPLPGDRYGPGHKLFTITRFTLAPQWAAHVFYGHAVTNDFPVSSARRFDIVLTFNALRPATAHNRRRTQGIRNRAKAGAPGSRSEKR
jgi:hypothetical protein